MHGITFAALLIAFNSMLLMQSDTVKLSRNTIDFGEVRQGDSRDIVLTITNTSSRKLELEKIRTTLGPFLCVANFKTLQPNESGELKISISTKRFTGRKSAACYVQFNVPEFQERLVLIKANIVSKSVNKT
jgi:Protein of unknown function (DUF1573)